MSEIKNGRLGLYGKVQKFEELGFKGLSRSTLYRSNNPIFVLQYIRNAAKKLYCILRISQNDDSDVVYRCRCVNIARLPA